MTGRDAFKIWAPARAKWVDWVRPVPFVAMHHSHGAGVAAGFTIPGIAYIAKAQENLAIIADMPGADAINEGIALAGLGFRPIPLYNGTNQQQGAMPLIENHAMESTLLWGASKLERIELPQNAPPVFLLDSNRTHRYKMHASIFDNSWDIYDQDMPSADYFLSSGIRRIIVRGEAIQKDLARILCKIQKKGITILFTDGYNQPKEVRLRKRPRKYN